ncbi:MAG TPA: hypothetical protein VIX12_03705 [Candidatus Binataceae bacterium]
MAEELTINGVKVRAGEAREEARLIALPSGSRASIRKGYGRDLMRAQRAANGGDATAIVFGLIAELAEIDGRRIVYEDVLGMNLGDVFALQAEVLGENFQDPPQQVSQDSYISGSR